ncbi:hypothetical protein Cni_G27132 [Canna indica]|uniref:Uncharacterized protein n=1 Tax=Canna indica TaxID=4628 RepID=A0AAQ3L4E0_9LILI|nr:hypothetical protein Cni_G27132 [Canna indica]
MRSALIAVVAFTEDPFASECPAARPELFLGLLRCILHRNDPGWVVGEQRQVARAGLWGLQEEEEEELLESMESRLINAFGALWRRKPEVETGPAVNFHH